MTAAAQHAGAASGPVGKKELAAALGWSRPTLDKRLKTDPKFPVAKIGDQSGGWQFDLAAVQTYLGGDASPPAELKPPPSPPKPAAIDRAQLRAIVAPPPVALPPRRSAFHEGEATARQRKDAAEAALKENKLALECGELLVRSEVRAVLSDIFAGLGNDLDALPEDIAKRLDLPDTAIPAIRKAVDDARTAMVKRAEPLLADE